MGKRFALFAVLVCLLISESFVSAQQPELVKQEYQQIGQEQLDRLRHGEIPTDGGYLPQGVWGMMEGVIEAPPEIVWQLFVDVNHWRENGLPNIIDAGGVPGAVLEEVGERQKADDFYKILGDRMIPALALRQKGRVWENITFQYYDLPWPVADRWMLVKTRFDETGIKSGHYKAEWEKAAGNVIRLTGALTLQPFEGDKYRTLMKYSVETNPGAHVPKFILKWGTRKTMPMAMRAIRRAALKQYGRPPPLLKAQ